MSKVSAISRVSVREASSRQTGFLASKAGHALVSVVGGDRFILAQSFTLESSRGDLRLVRMVTGIHHGSAGCLPTGIMRDYTLKEHDGLLFRDTLAELRDLFDPSWYLEGLGLGLVVLLAGRAVHRTGISWVHHHITTWLLIAETVTRVIAFSLPYSLARALLGLVLGVGVGRAAAKYV